MGGLSATRPRQNLGFFTFSGITNFRCSIEHFFVHTDKMKAELLIDFEVPEKAVTVIPFGVNNSVPDTDLTPNEAKRRLGIDSQEKTILFFGRMRPYKGLD